MKGHLFGLGAMLVDAGLMFVLMHGEVEATHKRNVGNDLFCKFNKIMLWAPNENKYIKYPFSGVSMECKVGGATCYILRAEGSERISCAKG